MLLRYTLYTEVCSAIHLGRIRQCSCCMSKASSAGGTCTFAFPRRLFKLSSYGASMQLTFISWIINLLCSCCGLSQCSPAPGQRAFPIAPHPGVSVTSMWRQGRIPGHWQGCIHVGWRCLLYPRSNNRLPCHTFSWDICALHLPVRGTSAFNYYLIPRPVDRPTLGKIRKGKWEKRV